MNLQFNGEEMRNLMNLEYKILNDERDQRYKDRPGDG